MKQLKLNTLFNPDGTLKSRFAYVSRRTRTDCVVVDHLADGVDTASVHTRVSTLLVEAGLVTWTVLVDNALWVDAAGNAVDDSTLAVATTWRRVARILRWC